MDGLKFRSMLNEMLPREKVEEAIQRLGVQQRQRKICPVELVWALIFAGGTEDCGRLAAALRAYTEDQSRPKITRGAFYKWFDEEAQGLMRELAQTCGQFVAAMPTHLPGILAGRKDWRAVDSTTVKLPKELLEHFPGTGDYAALKVHKLYSLGVENIVSYHLTPARSHDGPQLTLDESWRGMGLLVDLGYASFRLLRESQLYDVHLVMKLKEGWKVEIDATVGEEQMRSWLTGCDFETLLHCEEFHLNQKEVLDVDVIVGPENDPIRLRLVGFPTEDDYLMFLTTVPRSTHTPEEVGTLYRLRWSIELDNKLNKSAFRLDQITAQSPVSAEILVHASMMAAMIANAFAHQDHLDRGFVGTQTPHLKEAPLHPMLVAKMIASCGHHLASMLADRETPLEQWHHRVDRIRHLSKDPNWRRKASILDQVKGRTAPRGRPRKMKQKDWEQQRSSLK